MSILSNKKALTDASVVLWILDNHFKTETGQPVEFVNHRFMIDYLSDNHRHKVSCKSTQIGETVMELFDDFHLVGKQHLNVIHSMHNSDFLKKFVHPKVNPLIQNNPAIRAMITTDSEGLKGFGTRGDDERFLYIIGANAESQALSYSADVLKVDEKDRSDLSVVEILPQRMDFSPIAWIREFSNPSAEGIGVDASWQRSNQFEWFVTCHRCNHASWLEFNEMSELYPAPHYINQIDKFFACGNCHLELSTADRIRGEWVARWLERDEIHGYHFSQMMAPWFTAERIIEKFDGPNSLSVQHFYNYVLGKAYTEANLKFSRETILRACRPAQPFRQGVVMGSDIGKPHWYWLGNSAGVFEIGKADSWDDLDRIFEQNKCDAWVSDAAPEFTEVQAHIRKYPGKFFGCRYVKDAKGIGIVRWQTGKEQGFVYADRTKIIDRLVGEVAAQEIRFMNQPSDLETLIVHASNMYRVVEQDDHGHLNVEWKTVGAETSKKPDHLVHAGVYWRIALERSMGGGGFVSDDKAGGSGVKSGPVVKNGKFEMQFDVKSSLEKARLG